MALKSKPLEAVRPDVPVHHVTHQDMVRINFLVPASTRKAWKRAALDEGITLTELISKAMQRYTNESHS
ncbi:hypothetical protein [Thiomonas sp. FB-Cd]|uniref:hypothetical protein n=1 Tax=Thiomonas sp. FB-Cd TaxID=1158292 RepID=UPI0004DF60D8|nr:hypothetical protein [Thiomonas sp. FB-Cd]